MNPKIKRERDVRALVEKAILIARMSPNTTDSPRDDLLATMHLLETQAYSTKAAKIVDMGVFLDLSKKMNALSLRFART
jgi:predicted site-specific integrase-resolvase